MFHHQQKSPLALGLVAGFTLCSPSHRPSNQAPRPQWTKQTCSGFLNRKLTIAVFWWLSLTCLNISCLDEPCFMVSKLLEKHPKLKTWGAQCPHQHVTKGFTKNILLSPMGWWLKPWVLMEWFGCFSSSSGELLFHHPEEWRSSNAKGWFKNWSVKLASSSLFKVNLLGFFKWPPILQRNSSKSLQHQHM